MATIRELLLQIPEHEEKAVEHCKRQDEEGVNTLDSYKKTISHALICAFDWGKTSEGFSFSFGNNTDWGFLRFVADSINFSLQGASAGTDTLDVKPVGITNTGKILKVNKFWNDYTSGGGGGGSPAGNYGNIQINRNSAFSSPASDSLTFTDKLSVKGSVTASNKLIVGATSAPAQSQIYVVGGTTGGNIDARGDSTSAQKDEANIEVEHPDYDGSSFTGYGVAMQTNGNVSSGSVLGYNIRNSAQIRFTSNTNIIRTTNNTSLRFGTNGSERMVLDSNGRFGIGVIAPLKTFHLVGTARMTSLGTASSDTSTNKPLGINSSGDIIPMTSWPVGSGVGDVSKVGTPVNNQVGVWTGDGTIEGDADFTFDGTTATIGGAFVGGDAGFGVPVPLLEGVLSLLLRLNSSSFCWSVSAFGNSGIVVLAFVGCATGLIASVPCRRRY